MVYDAELKLMLAIQGDGSFMAVRGRSKPARDGRMKPSHFEVGVALGAAGAADQRDEQTQREPTTFHYHAVGPGLDRSQDRP